MTKDLIAFLEVELEKMERRALAAEKRVRELERSLREVIDGLADVVEEGEAWPIAKQRRVLADARDTLKRI